MEVQKVIIEVQEESVNNLSPRPTSALLSNFPGPAQKPECPPGLRTWACPVQETQFQPVKKDEWQKIN